MGTIRFFILYYIMVKSRITFLCLKSPLFPQTFDFNLLSIDRRVNQYFYLRDIYLVHKNKNIHLNIEKKNHLVT